MVKMSPFKCKQSGFSMIELLISMVIIAIALLGLMALQAASIRSVSGNRGREVAVYLSKSMLDQIQAAAQMRSMNRDYQSGFTLSTQIQFNVPLNQDNGPEAFTVNGKLPGDDAPGLPLVYQRVWRRTRELTPNCSEFLAQVTWTPDVNQAGQGIPKTIAMRRVIAY